jgi:hypothetical protein
VIHSITVSQLHGSPVIGVRDSSPGPSGKPQQGTEQAEAALDDQLLHRAEALVHALGSKRASTFSKRASILSKRRSIWSKHRLTSSKRSSTRSSFSSTCLKLLSPEV